VSIADRCRILELVESIPLENLVNESCSLASLQGVRRLLLESGRDPRGKFTLVKPRNDVRTIEDLKDGMELEGIVTNVTNFGAFVDVGVQQDGLVHLSQMSNRFIRDPREAAKVGDTVRVKIISVEVETKRIGLSIKALLPPPQKRRRKPPVQHRGPRPQPKAEAAAGEAVVAAGASPQAERPQRRPQPRRQGQPKDRRSSGPHGRGPRPRRREAPAAAQPARQSVLVASDPAQPVDPEPEIPERSLQEKIAILQSKFRGLG
jgi:transcriptional accessory protein Tex/SPT6